MAPPSDFRNAERSQGPLSGFWRWEHLALAMLAVSAAIWVLALVYEAQSDRPRLTAGPPARSSDAADSDSLLSLDAEPAEPAVSADELPLSVDGWIVQGVQPVPGSGGKVVEGNYTPRDELRSLVMPLVAYVQVTDDQRKRASIDTAFKNRFTQAQEDPSLDGVSARSGRSEDHGSYFVAWEQNGKLYAVQTTFRFRIPASGGDPVIREAAEEIARAVIAHRPGQGGSE